MKILSCGGARNFVNSINCFDRRNIIHNTVSHFEDGEMCVKIDNHRDLFNENVLVVQSLSNNVNDALMELLFTLDVVRNALPKSIGILLTYMGYARQDRLENLNESFSAKVTANMLSLPFVSRIFVVDIHSAQSLGFFNLPATNIATSEFVLEDIKKKNNLSNVVLISPDAGGVKTIIKLSDILDADYNIALKYRPRANENKILSMVGHALENRDCILVDDIVDSAGTLCNVAEKLAKSGANSIIAYITHPVLSPKAKDRIKRSHITKLYLGNTIDCAKKIENLKNVEVLSLSDFCVEKALSLGAF
ncbi:MAG: ribose-phosphate diphosphokinase [Rickettsiales bacterium]|jgi:ribose-phosphate pyrophosphokinase|nr:ribose-phosphate diphosphokinase [Rickettsiales bacterium]